MADDSDGNVTLAEYVRQRRLQAGMTQEALAEQAGLTVDTVGALERGRRRRLYPNTARALADALGLGDTERAVLAELASGQARRVPDPPPVPAAPPTQSVAPSNLPAQLTSFVGRERELTGAALLMARGVRLLTLTGPGGAGKTRLAIEGARTVGRHFPHGVWIAELAPLADPALVPQAVATALGVRDAAGRTFVEGIIAALGEQRVLLVLDNCEHLLDACATLVAAVLGACPSVTIVTTSREPLRVTGEHVYLVPPLALPPAGWVPTDDESVAALTEFAAVALFFERARSVRSDFMLTSANAEAVVDICRRLDGLPLAIELAAARVRVLPPGAITARLDDRFRLVTGGARDLLPRHQTLRALIDWSYDLLDDGERVLLRRLSVFAGGWTLEAAEAVCGEMGDVLDPLTGLVDKSLVVADAHGEAVRFALLESIRVYANEKLAASGEEERVRDGHAAHYLDLGERACAELRGPAQVEWLGRLEDEHNNLREALRWLLDSGRATAATRLCAAIYRFWYVNGYFTEGRAWLDRALATPPDEPSAAYAEVLYAAGAFANLQGYRVAARHLLDESIELWREVGDQEGLANALDYLGLVTLYDGDVSETRALFQQTLPMRRALGRPWGLAMTLDKLGNLAYWERDDEAARPFYEESLQYMREAGHQHGMATELIALGRVAHQQGHEAEAAALFREALALSRELKAGEYTASCLEGLAGVDARAGRAVRSARLFGAAATLRTAMGAPLVGRLQVDYDRDLATARGMVDAETFATAYAAGAALPLDSTVAEALASEGRPSPETVSVHILRP
jgi:predicted ATPase/transcriptional regulator with XRE-family HTH domain